MNRHNNASVLIGGLDDDLTTSRQRQHHEDNLRSVAYDGGQEDGMDTPAAPQLSVDAASDYGSDFDLPSDYGSELELEETLLGDILVEIATTAPKTLIYPSIEVEDEVSQPAVVIHHPPPSAVVRLGKAAVEGSPGRGVRGASVEVEYDRPSRESWSVPREEPPAAPAPQAQDVIEDRRSPLERFRTKPQKPLSVTDLVSPAWCELQYWYTLTKYGRKVRTPAMKQGSKVHRVLEEQVHQIVPIQIKSREDGFGLRIWNTIQGLRTLRETGLTRELEVWGVIDGQVVNGIIDEISYTCPDPDFKDLLEKSKAQKSGGTLPLGQPNIEESFNKTTNAWLGTLEPERQVYIADVKTRGVQSVPVGASLRPTWMQLMLYRKLLESLSLNTVDAETIFARYNLEPLEPFTEIFMLEINRLDNQGKMTMGDESPFSVLQASEIEQHSSLLALWSLMISDFSRTIDTYSDILRAEFRYSKTGDLIGSELTVYDAPTIEEFIATKMKWWKGEREAQGVEIEEAFKCRICDFAEECTWRKNKVEEALEKHRLRTKARGKSAI